MKMITFDRIHDRAAWPSGVWDNEPDKVQWLDDATKLPCLIVRNHDGAWCGYVGVPYGHPWYNKDYNDLNVDVHGGLTYSDRCAGHICHVVDPGDPDDVWWLGFDCLHFQDFAPGLTKFGLHGTYKDVDYVKAEVTSLAKQASEAA